MKQLILLSLILILLSSVNAQRTESINSEILHPEKKFELLDKTEITTGNLINRSSLRGMRYE